MNMSIDVEMKKSSLWHYVTGVLVLSVSYVGIILTIGWLTH